MPENKDDKLQVTFYTTQAIKRRWNSKLGSQGLKTTHVLADFMEHYVGEATDGPEIATKDPPASDYKPANRKAHGELEYILLHAERRIASWIKGNIEVFCENTRNKEVQVEISSDSEKKRGKESRKGG